MGLKSMDFEAESTDADGDSADADVDSAAADMDSTDVVLEFREPLMGGDGASGMAKEKGLYSTGMDGGGAMKVIEADEFDRYWQDVSGRGHTRGFVFRKRGELAIPRGMICACLCRKHKKMVVIVGNLDNALVNPCLGQPHWARKNNYGKIHVRSYLWKSSTVFRV